MMLLGVAVGPFGIVRILGGLAAAVWGITTALGSGATDVAEILGIPLTAAQRVLVAGVLFGAFVLWDNAVLRRRLANDADAPYLGWTSPRAFIRDDGALVVQVDCENSGPADSVAVLRAAGSFAWSSHGHRLEMPTQEWSRINSSLINQQTHRWMVEIREVGRADGAAIQLGEFEVGWRLVYYDSDYPKGERHYITQASIRARFDNRAGPGIITGQWLDSTSDRAERHQRWVKWKKDADRARKAAEKAARAKAEADEAAKRVVP